MENRSCAGCWLLGGPKRQCKGSCPDFISVATEQHMIKTLPRACRVQTGPVFWNMVSAPLQWSHAFPCMLWRTKVASQRRRRYWRGGWPLPFLAWDCFVLLLEDGTPRDVMPWYQTRRAHGSWQSWWDLSKHASCNRNGSGLEPHTLVSERDGINPLESRRRARSRLLSIRAVVIFWKGWRCPVSRTKRRLRNRYVQLAMDEMATVIFGVLVLLSAVIDQDGSC